MRSPRRRRLLHAARQTFAAFRRSQFLGSWALLAATLIAVGWANSPLARLHGAVFDRPIAPRLHLELTLRAAIDEGAMSLFFLLVGLELKRELIEGELRSLRRAMLPAIAALGGMIAPAAIYLALNPHRPARAGFGIPVATDIAFALGCTSVVRRHLPRSLPVFLTALAIFDDLGAVLLIALFYGRPLVLLPLLGALGLIAVLFVLGRRRVGSPTIWLLALIAMWTLLHQAGIHATLAGVIVGVLVPAARVCRGTHHSPLDRLEHQLTLWVSLLIVPLFALANAAVAVRLSPLLHEGGRVTLGIVLGLFVGKQIGVLGASAIAIKLGWCPMPSGARWSQLHGIAILAGIGFTMSLFVDALAFGGATALGEQAKLAVMLASVLAAGVGLGRLWRTSPPSPSSVEGGT